MNAVSKDAGPDGSADDERDASDGTAGKGGSGGSAGSGGKAGAEPTAGKAGMGGAGAAGSVGGNGGAGMGGAGASGAGDGGKGGASGSAGSAPMSCTSTVPGGSCNLVTSCGCSDDKACYVTDVKGSTATVGCVAPGRVNPGSLCNGRTDCVEGYGCVGTDPAQCRAYCESDKDCGTKGICDTATATVDNKTVPIEGYKVCFETCSVNSDCSTQCCVNNTSGQKVCAATDYCTDQCSTDADCSGGCCVAGTDGHKACAKGQTCESVKPGETCASSLVCVGFSANQSLCVSDDEGSTCHDRCTANADCKSNCCAVTKEGTHYCTAAKYCSTPSCKATAATCAATSECCGGSAGSATCVEQTGLGPVCQPFCTANSQCSTNCCAALKNGGNVCAPVVYCQ